MADYRNPPHPIAVLIRGLPGSGKSYLAAKLAVLLGEDAAVLLDPDAIDYTSTDYQKHVEQLTAEGVDASLHAYRYLRSQAYQAIENHRIIIWNQAFTNAEIFQKMIARLQDHATAHHTILPILVVEVTINADVARARIAQRNRQGGHAMAAETFTRFHRSYTSFANLGYETVSVNGQDNVDDSAAAVLTKLNTLRDSSISKSP